jgi:putative transposase
LFRYRIVGEATSARLDPAERGRIVRELARRVYEHPDGSQRQYTRGTLDRWIRAYREQGLSGLKPEPRSDLGTVRRHPELLDEVCALRAELPTRSAAQIPAILFARHRIRIAQRTIDQHLRQRGLHRAALGGLQRAFGRFQASRPNELWIGDVLVGPFVPYPRTSSSRRAYLFALLDDYSSLICTLVGSMIRTRARARTCCALPFSVGVCPSGGTSIMARPIPTLHWSARARCWAFA